MDTPTLGRQHHAHLMGTVGSALREQLWIFQYVTNKLSFSGSATLNWMLCLLDKEGSYPRSVPENDGGVCEAVCLPAASQASLSFRRAGTL